MTTIELISELEKIDPNRVVKRDFKGPGYSDRGYYEMLEFEPAEDVTIGSMVVAVKGAMGQIQVGYKGGDYLTNEYTDVTIGQWGEPGEEIGSFHIAYWRGEL